MNKKVVGITIFILIIILALVLCLFIFNNKDENESNNSNNNNSSNSNQVQNNGSNTSTDDNNNDNDENNNNTGNEVSGNMKMYIKVNGHTLRATLSNNSSVDALVEKLTAGDITIDMSDYASMEKVGPFGFSLPRNDESINTGAGDLILYQGKSFVIYYDHNSWNFTRLGKIDDITQNELKNILGNGSVTVTLSLSE